MKQTHGRCMSAADKAAGNTLRTLRKEAGKTQGQVAAAIGITFQQIQKYELGRNRLSVGRMVDICAVLDVTPESFINRMVH